MRTLALFLSFGFLTSSFAVEQPNILFAIADDWGPHASAYGTPWVKTPNFDRVAKEGLLFNYAYTPNAKCAPSRACILHWLERVGMDYVKGKIVEDVEGRKVLYARLLNALKDAKDPWATSREPQAIKQFIPITVAVDA